MWVVAQSGRAPRCERGRCRFKSCRSTQTLNAEVGMMNDELSRSSELSIHHSSFTIHHSSFHPGPWQKGVCTSLSRKTMTVRVRSVPPIDSRFRIWDLRSQDPHRLVPRSERAGPDTKIQERIPNARRQNLCLHSSIAHLSRCERSAFHDLLRVPS